MAETLNGWPSSAEHQVRVQNSSLIQGVFAKSVPAIYNRVVRSKIVKVKVKRLFD